MGRMEGVEKSISLLGSTHKKVWIRRPIRRPDIPGSPPSMEIPQK